MTETTNQKPSRIKRIKQFLKPSLCELIAMFWEGPLVSLPILTAAADDSFGTLGKGALYALIPQAITYLGARAYELFGKKDTLMYYAVRTKIPSFK